MTVKAEKIVADVLALPAPVRAYVAEKLLESLDATAAPKLTPAWKAEVRRRCGEIDRGTGQLRDAEAVFAKAFAALE